MNESIFKNIAIAKIKEIQSGNFDRNKPKDIPKGRVAEKVWNDVKFAYGMDYGAIVILMQMFGVTEKDLG